MSDYPKLLFKSGQEITVHSPAEEAEKVADGFAPAASDAPASEPPAEAPAEPVAPESEPSDDEPEGPTFGAPHDDTHARRPRSGGKKK